jgi:hypothetical protein
VTWSCRVWIKIFLPELKQVGFILGQKNNKIIMTRPEHDLNQPIDTSKFNISSRQKNSGDSILKTIIIILTEKFAI